jgi:hypothetical protein
MPSLISSLLFGGSVDPVGNGGGQGPGLRAELLNGAQQRLATDRPDVLDRLLDVVEGVVVAVAVRAALVLVGPGEVAACREDLVDGPVVAQLQVGGAPTDEDATEGVDADLCRRRAHDGRPGMSGTSGQPGAFGRHTPLT